MYKYLVGIYLALQATDGLMTQWAMGTGNYVEQNAMMAPIAGDWTLTIVKVGGATLLLLILRPLLKTRFAKYLKVGVAGCIGLLGVIIAQNIGQILG